MCADRKERQREPLDDLWRLGLEELVGQAEAPARAWEAIRHQVEAGPSRPMPTPSAASSLWRVASQFAALAAVFLILIGFRAEAIRQGALPIPTVWHGAQPPIAVGVKDTLSARAAYASARGQRALEALRYPSRDPILQNQGIGAHPTDEVMDPVLLHPSQDQAIQHRRERSAASGEEALRALWMPSQDPLLTHQPR